MWGSPTIVVEVQQSGFLDKYLIKKRTYATLATRTRIKQGAAKLKCNNVKLRICTFKKRN
jgi:hypothetical protein